MEAQVHGRQTWPANMAGEHGRRLHCDFIGASTLEHKCMSVRACVHVYVCVQTSVHVYMRVRIHACKCICVRLRMHVNLHACGQFLGHQKISGLRVGKWQLSTPHRKNCQSTRPCSPHPPLSCACTGRTNSRPCLWRPCSWKSCLRACLWRPSRSESCHRPCL